MPLAELILVLLAVSLCAGSEASSSDERRDRLAFYLSVGILTAIMTLLHSDIENSDQTLKPHL